MLRLLLVATALATTPLVVAGADAARTTLLYDFSLPPVRFAAAEIRAAAADRGLALLEGDLAHAESRPGGPAIVLVVATNQVSGSTRFQGTPPGTQAWQGYTFRRTVEQGRTNLVALAGDAVGAMYAGLEVAEAIRFGTLEAIPEREHTPYIERRGIKFNIPLDVRTPSYSDNSDAAQANIPEMWSFDFWREFLDEMARHRFNVLTLWSLHPFPSLVRVPEFPEVALEDVQRTMLKLDDTFSHSGSDMVRPAMRKDVETVQRLSIGEKIAFWREVMQHAHDRGIEVYWFTWNTFVFGAEGQYGITPALTNRTTIAYFRASVRELLLTYPLLAGLGITAGEQMENRRDEFSREKWLWQTYGEGIRDAQRLQPGRPVRLIHRFHMTGQSDILREWGEYPGTLDLSFKYAIAHMYSITNPPFIREALPHLPPGLRTWLTVRNDDIYSFRWGDPAFARAFIRAMPGREHLAGFYMGPDGYCWGREFMSTEPETPRQLVIKKQWYSFMLWGRLSYEPDLPDSLFQRSLADRFPQAPTEALFAAWSAASQVFPLITRFCWGDIDLRWFPEACWSHPRHKGFYTLRDFIEVTPMPGSGVIGILEYRQRLLNQEPIAAVTPLQVADALTTNAVKARRLLTEVRQSQPVADRVERARAGETSLRPGAATKELRLTLGDLEAMAHLADYYASKIRGATELAIFDRTREPAHQLAAVQQMETALVHWKNYVTAYTAQYRQPLLYNRVGVVNLPALTAKVAADIELARTWRAGTLGAPKSNVADQPFRK